MYIELYCVALLIATCSVCGAVVIKGTVHRAEVVVLLICACSTALLILTLQPFMLWYGNSKSKYLKRVLEQKHSGTKTTAGRKHSRHEDHRLRGNDKSEGVIATHSKAYISKVPDRRQISIFGHSHQYKPKHAFTRDNAVPTAHPRIHV